MRFDISRRARRVGAVGVALVVVSLVAAAIKVGDAVGLYLAPLYTTPATVVGGTLVGYALADARGAVDRHAARVGYAVGGALIALAGSVAMTRAFAGGGSVLGGETAVWFGAVAAAWLVGVSEVGIAVARGTGRDSLS